MISEMQMGGRDPVPSKAKHAVAEAQHTRWGSRVSFILAATGAAVGLGNIWKFPYMVGAYGGGAFVLVYLCFVLLIALPLMIGEILIGRLGRQNPVNSLRALSLQYSCSPRWCYSGWWGAATLLLVLSFYSVVAGWSLAYLLYAISGRLSSLSVQAIPTLWTHLQSQPGALLGYHAVFMAMTMGVVAGGVRQGIERATYWMMPALFLILLLLVGYALRLPGLGQAVSFLWHCRWEAITGQVIIEALGHAFFSLAVGAGCMLAYGSYLPDEAPIAGTAYVIVLLNVGVALLTGLAIFPIVFTYHLPPDSGPSLMFQTLPIAFLQMGAGLGWVLSVLFFVLLLFAAWTSSISLAEPLVVLLKEKRGYGRGQAALCVGVVAWLLGIGSLLSFNVGQHWTMGAYGTFFDVVTRVTTDFMLPVGGMAFALFVGACLRRSVSFRSVIGCTRYEYALWCLLIRFVVPLGLVLLLFCAR